MATTSLLLCTGRRRAGYNTKTGPAEPWFALNRSVYQAILNVALAEMTSASSPSIPADCFGGGMRSGCVSENSHKDGSELLRMLLSDEESNRLKLSETASCDNESLADKTRLSNDYRQSTETAAMIGSLPPLIPIESLCRSPIKIECNISDSDGCAADSGKEDNSWSSKLDISSNTIDNYTLNQLDAAHKVVPKAELEADCDSQSSNAADNDVVNQKSPRSDVASSPLTSDGTLTPQSFADYDPTRSSSEISSTHRTSSPSECNPDTEQSPLTSSWIPINKNFVTTIVNRQLYQTPITSYQPTAVARSSPTQRASVSTINDPTCNSFPASPHIDHRSGLLADLLRQTDEIASFPMTARKRQSISVGCSEISPLYKNEDRLPTKKPKCSPHDNKELDHRLSSSGSSSSSRVHVRSTWPVPNTSDRHSLGQGSNRGSRRQLPTQLFNASRRFTESLLGTSVSSRAGPRILSCNQSPVAREYSQVWTAVNKTVVLDVIDQLLDLDFDDVISVEDSAIDLTVVRRPSSDKSSGTALNVPSKRDLLALFSQGSTAYRTHHQNHYHQHQCAAHRQPFTAQRRTRNPFAGQEEINSENQDGGAFEWRVVEVGSDEDEEMSSQFKWKSNIMRRLRKEQTTVGPRGSTLATPPDNGQVWRRGASSIAATGS